MMKEETLTESTQLQQLAAEFPGSALKSRKQGGRDLTYLSIDATINRINDVLGPNWGITQAKTDLITLEDGVGYVAKCEIFLTATVDAVTKTTYGVGADKGTDVDKISKTALAEAIKKACHQLGIGLYLWDPAGIARAQRRMKLDSNRDSEATLKRAVFEIAKERDPSVTTAAQVAKVFGRKAGELADKAVLVEILEAEGVL